jgi:hypothetical protein
MFAGTLPPPPSLTSPTGQSGMSPGSQYNPTDPSGNPAYTPTSPATPTNAASFGPNDAYDPLNFAGATGLVPLGNGMYFDPSTGALRGGGALGLGSGAAGLNPIDRRF